MILKKINIFLFIIFSLFPINEVFAQSSNVGFVPGNIWYSKDPFEEGDKIKIYTFIYNSDSKELSGTVVFFDKNILLGKKDFRLEGKTANEISIDWVVQTGDHKIFAKIENAKFLISKDKYEEIYIADNKTEESSRTVSKKIIIKENSNNINIIDDKFISSILNTGETIKESIPDTILKPISSTTNKIEDIRKNIKLSSDNKKEEIKKEIQALTETKDKVTSKTATKKENNSLLKPFKYVELFLLSISSFILNTKILFYGIILIIIFIILRFVWQKIF